MKIQDVKKIGIAGAGTMGSGIAQVFAAKGCKVVVTDLGEADLEKSRRLVKLFNANLVEEGLLTEDATKNIVDNISYSTDKKVFSEADLIIEAIIEKMEIKQAFWGEVELIARDDAFFATNTSGLSINEMCSKLQNKKRFIGMHFWNPPHIIPLVELIRADGTADETVDDLKELMYAINKEPVVVRKDAPGFIGNRLQFAVFREALHILEEGIAGVDDVDLSIDHVEVVPDRPAPAPAH
ncbi:MAG TPA: 3-hydroxyacyl-CoA dehydrogenase family protein [Synergistales bacterium]|nr:3-hydroxyacyl-CoA dehydrogenase family protein [Synergistales bacterium]